MDFIRVLHIQHYDPARRRFSSLAFKNSSGNGGISVFDAECAVSASGKICPHIHRFYSGITGVPPIYWRIPRESLEELGAVFLPSPSTTGDLCHANIQRLNDRQARAYLLAEASPARLRACLPEEEAAVDEGLLARWRQEAVS